jgi:hypothetical protein
MSHGTDALYDFAAHDPRRSSPQAIPLEARAHTQRVLGNLALAFVATTCLWTVYSHVAGGDAAPGAAAPAALPAEFVAAASPAHIVQESFAALHKGYSGLLDGRHLRLTPGTLSRGKPSTLADHLVALATVAPKSQDRFPQSPAEAQQTAQSVPMPPARPTKLASLPQSPAASAPATSTPAPYAPKTMVEDKATVLSLISSNKNSLYNRLFGKKPKHEGPTLAYASADGGIAGDTQTILFDGMPKYDQWTAVYDISARKVYMPDGTELEAHSGLGPRLDDPRHVHRKMHGATPPHVYDLSMRESLFHGVEALRMIPVGGEGRIFGRTGLLAHTYMLGPKGDSNGCVSFQDYDTFLQAYKKGQVKRMVVVAKLG